MTLRDALTLAVDRILVPIEGMHRTISSRWFRAVGPLAKPVHIAHDTVAGIVYGSIRAGSDIMGWGIEAMQPSAAAGDGIQAWISGLWGSESDGRPGGLERGMTIRDVTGNSIAVSDAAGGCGFTPTGHLAFLVHGLGDTERCWTGTRAEPGIAQRLEDRSHVSSILVRYNTGLSLAANGALLAELVGQVVDGWPLPVRSISLVGHSMGGLVATSACVSASTAEQEWVAKLTDVVTIGTPHGGAPLEKLAAAATWGLGLAATTRPLAAFLDHRSQGIKDLRTGRIAAASPALGQLAHVRHHFVGGVLTDDPSHPLGAVVGDLMVRPISSTSSELIEPSNTLILGGVHHFGLVDNPAVIEHVTRWLDPAGRCAFPPSSDLPCPEDQPSRVAVLH